jgi:hypothetical protein
MGHGFHSKLLVELRVTLGDVPWPSIARFDYWDGTSFEHPSAACAALREKGLKRSVRSAAWSLSDGALSEWAAVVSPLWALAQFGALQLDGLIVVLWFHNIKKWPVLLLIAVVGKSLKKKPRVWVPSNWKTGWGRAVGPKVYSKIAWDHSWHCTWPAEFLDDLSAEAAKNVNLCVLGTFWWKEI